MIQLVYFVTPNPYKHVKDKKELVSVITDEEQINNLPEKITELNVGREFWQGYYIIESPSTLAWNEIPVK